MHGVERGKIQRLLQRITYRYRERMGSVHKEATTEYQNNVINSQQRNV